MLTDSIINVCSISSIACGSSWMGGRTSRSFSHKMSLNSRQPWVFFYMCVISQRLNMKMISRAGSSNQWCLCVCVCVLSVFEFVCEWTPSSEKAASFPCHYLTLHPLKQRGLVHHVMWMTSREWEFCKDILVLRQHEKWMCVFSMWSV